VLLKNENDILPISKATKAIAVIGTLADSKNEMNGNWSGDSQPNDPITILEALKQKYPQTRVRYEPGCDPTCETDAGFARAVAPLSRLAAWCLPLLRPGGSLIALKGSQARAELAACADDLGRLGAVDWEVVTCGVGLLDAPTTVVRVVLGDTGVPLVGRPGRGGKRRP